MKSRARRHGHVRYDPIRILSTGNLLFREQLTSTCRRIKQQVAQDECILRETALLSQRTMPRKNPSCRSARMMDQLNCQLSRFTTTPSHPSSASLKPTKCPDSLNRRPKTTDHSCSLPSGTIPLYMPGARNLRGESTTHSALPEYTRDDPSSSK